MTTGFRRRIIGSLGFITGLAGVLHATPAAATPLARIRVDVCNRGDTDLYVASTWKDLNGWSANAWSRFRPGECEKFLDSSEQGLVWYFAFAIVNQDGVFGILPAGPTSDRWESFPAEEYFCGTEGGWTADKIAKHKLTDCDLAAGWKPVLHTWGVRVHPMGNSRVDMSIDARRTARVMPLWVTSQATREQLNAPRSRGLGLAEVIGGLVLGAAIAAAVSDPGPSDDPEFEQAYALYEKRDYAGARNAFWPAATRGHAPSVNMIGVIADDQGNLTEAVKWYRNAADRGLAVAQYNLGNSYRRGRGVAQDAAQAVNWFGKAAGQDFVHAQLALAAMYAAGEGVPRDPVRAVEWVRKAADKGNAQAQFEMGTAYTNGFGVAQSDQQALQWYRLAADKGHAAAQYSLAFMYENGQGTAAQLDEAVKWYRRAAAQGDADAQAALRRLGR
jgi:TPR repeat protein